MATRSKSVCRHPGCRQLLDAPGRCEQHARQVRQQSDAERGTAHERGYTKRWHKARTTYLSRHPLCVECAKHDRVVPATDVDHIIPHRLKEALDSGDADRIARAQELFWDTKNWQSLCHPHHSRKTAREDGGFGR